MRHYQCLYNPAQALQRVFLASFDNAALNSGRALLPSPFLAPRTLPRPRRTFTTSPAHFRVVKQETRFNERIPYKYVYVLEGTGGGSLPKPELLTAVLEQLNTKTHRLVMVAPPPEPDPDSKVVAPPAAVCRLVDLKKESAAAKQAEVAARQRNVNTKGLELSWSIAKGDLDHKLRRLREFLGKGMRVELVLARKKGGRTASSKEAQTLLDTIREEATTAVPGSKEYRKMDGNVGGTVKLFLEGPPVAAGKAKTKANKKQEEDYEGSSAT